jgi:hypothetical protein
MDNGQVIGRGPERLMAVAPVAALRGEIILWAVRLLVR